MPKNNHPPRSSSLYPEDISPPESLHARDEERNTNGRDSPDVSPVSDTPSPSASGRSNVTTLGRFNSNLPVPKKTRKFWNRPSTESPEQGSITTHWDVYSGEPTTSEKGKPPSTTPSAVKLHADPSPGRLNGYGTSTHISAGNAKTENSIGRKRVASRDLNNAPIVRPEWKGAGGRHKILNPLFDKPLPPGKAPTFPAGSETYHQEELERARLSEERVKSPTSPRIPMNSAPRRASKAGQPSIVINTQDLQQNITAPKDKIEDTTGDMTPPAIPQNSQIRNSSLTADDTRSPLERNPSNEEMKRRRSQPLPELPQTPPQREPTPPEENVEQPPQATTMITPTSIDKAEDPSQIESRFRAGLHHMHIQDEPPSRFSATTYATTTYDSPPATPEVGSDSPVMSTTPNSILNRKRPVAPAGMLSSRVAARKPTPSEMSVTSQPTSESKRKELPKSPPEKQAVSRVAALQAKVDNLKRRRNNLQTVIYELTHVVQPSSIAYDMASRQEIKRTVEGLNKELADVQKDEHETGLKLHRAMKRDDEFAAYEPTSIWVRRVTS